MLKHGHIFLREVYMTREKRLDIRLSPEEREALEILATREGRNISELARELLRSAIDARRSQAVGLVNMINMLNQEVPNDL
jgi:predicted transcriptional regulator